MTLCITITDSGKTPGNKEERDRTRPKVRRRVRVREEEAVFCVCEYAEDTTAKKREGERGAKRRTLLMLEEEVGGW